MRSARLALLALLCTAPPVEAQLPLGSRIDVLADKGDPRVEIVRQAVSYWRGLLEREGLPAVLGDVEHDEATERRVFETHARRLAQQAGRVRGLPRGTGPPSPDALARRAAQVVILLSGQKVMPFAWPLATDEPGPLIFIALPVDAEPEIVRHELGHALGLPHSGRTGLMCLPCENGGSRDVTPADVQRLRDLYSPR